MAIIETSRLYLRELTPADAESFFLLNADPEVMQFTGDDPFATITDARNFLENYSHYEQYGFGRWAVIRKADGKFLGWCGLKYSPDLDEYDIGFRFFKQFWNRGYATEAAKACIDYGFNQLRIAAIVGRAMGANSASVKVLEKLGMEHSCDIDFCGSAGVAYTITKPEPGRQ